MRLYRAAGAFVLLSLLVVEATGDSLRVATYNLRNYLICGRLVDGRYYKEYPKPESEKEALRKVILAAQPDVFAIQEMGQQSFLDEFQADMRAYGIDYEHTALMRGVDEVRHLAVLSRVPFVEVIPHDDITFQYFGERTAIRRGLLEVVFENEGVRWSLFVVHLKSRWTVRKDDPKAAKQRLGEAEAIRDFLISKLGRESDQPYLIVGDFNDRLNSPTLRRFLKKGKSVLSHAIPAHDSSHDAWTFHYRKEEMYERVDFILASPGIYPRVRDQKGAVVDLLPYSRVASDHRLVYVDLDF